MNYAHLKHDFSVAIQWLTPLVILGAKQAILYVLLPLLGILVARSANFVADRWLLPFLHRKFPQHG